METHRLSEPEAGAGVKLSVAGAEFWISVEPQTDAASTSGGGNSRMVLVTPAPDGLFRRAIATDATEVFPVGERQGWRLGRLIDPFGLHWEIGHRL